MCTMDFVEYQVNAESATQQRDVFSFVCEEHCLSISRVQIL